MKKERKREKREGEEEEREIDRRRSAAAFVVNAQISTIHSHRLLTYTTRAHMHLQCMHTYTPKPTHHLQVILPHVTVPLCELPFYDPLQDMVSALDSKGAEYGWHDGGVIKPHLLLHCPKTLAHTVRGDGSDRQ